MNNIRSCSCSNLRLDNDNESDIVSDGLDVSDSMEIGVRLSAREVSVLSFLENFINFRFPSRKIISILMFFYLLALARSDIIGYIESHGTDICALLAIDRVLASVIGYDSKICHYILDFFISDDGGVNRTEILKDFLNNKMDDLKNISLHYFNQINSMLINSSVDIDLCPQMHECLDELGTIANPAFIPAETKIIYGDTFKTTKIGSSMNSMNKFYLIPLFFAFFLLLIPILYLSKGRSLNSRSSLFYKVRRLFMDDELPVRSRNSDDVKFIEVPDDRDTSQSECSLLSRNIDVAEVFVDGDEEVIESSDRGIIVEAQVHRADEK